MIRTLVSTLLLFLINGCITPSQKAVSALNRGDQCEFCRISLNSLASDKYSIHNLGVCYEHGYCSYEKNSETAIGYYKQAARWGVEPSVTALKAKGIEVPLADLKVEEERKKAELSALFIGALAAGLAAYGQNNNSNQYQSFNQRSFVPQDASGCCSYHNGIAHNELGQKLCHIVYRRFICNDNTLSPNCPCSPY